MNAVVGSISSVMQMNHGSLLSVHFIKLTESLTTLEITRVIETNAFLASVVVTGEHLKIKLLLGSEKMADETVSQILWSARLNRVIKELTFNISASDTNSREKVLLEFCSISDDEFKIMISNSTNIIMESMLMNLHILYLLKDPLPNPGEIQHNVNKINVFETNIEESLKTNIRKIIEFNEQFLGIRNIIQEISSLAIVPNFSLQQRQTILETITNILFLYIESNGSFSTFAHAFGTFVKDIINVKII